MNKYLLSEAPPALEFSFLDVDPIDKIVPLLHEEAVIDSPYPARISWFCVKGLTLNVPETLLTPGYSNDSRLIKAIP